MAEQSVGRSQGGDPDRPFGQRKLGAQEKVPLFRRHPLGAPRQNLAFTGRGFIPDYMSEGGLVMMPEASGTSVEGGFVNGADGMMPVAGVLPSAQKGQRPDTGAGGAGSFATRVAAGAKG